MKTKNKRFVRQIAGGYFQDRDGKWWVLNPQLGWVPVPEGSRALAAYRAEDIRARLS